MGIWEWVKIITEILKLIVEGMDKDDAVKNVASKFGVSVDEIWKRGGF